MYLLSTESIMFSFFYNNAIFVLAFMFFALYAFTALSAPYCYTASMVVTSALVWQVQRERGGREVEGERVLYGSYLLPLTYTTH